MARGINWENIKTCFSPLTGNIYISKFGKDKIRPIDKSLDRTNEVIGMVMQKLDFELTNDKKENPEIDKVCWSCEVGTLTWERKSKDEKEQV